MGQIKAADKVPSGPVIAAIDAMGGMTSLPGLGVHEQVEFPDIRRGKFCGYQVQVHILRTAAEQTTFSRLEKCLDRSRERGWMNYYDVDEFCCEYLGLHPSELYGEVWFSYGSPITEQDAQWARDWCSDEPAEQELMAA